MSNSVDIKKTFNVDPSSLPAKLPKSEKDPMRIAAFWTQKNISGAFEPFVRCEIDFEFHFFFKIDEFGN